MDKQTFWSTMVSWLQDMPVQLWHKTCGINQQISDLTLDLLHKMQSITHTAKMIENPEEMEGIQGNKSH